MSQDAIQKLKEQLLAHINNQKELSPAEVAEGLKELKKSDKSAYSELLPKLNKEDLAEVAIEMPEHMLKDVIMHIPQEKIVDAIETLESDDATDLIQNIEDIDENKAKELFDSLEIESKKEISALMNYEENEAGAYMQVELFKAHLSESLQTAIERFRQLKKSGELVSVFVLFITDSAGVLRYAVPIDDMILFEPNDSLAKIMSEHGSEYEAHFVRDDDDIKEVAQIVKNYDLSSIAVVDKAGVLLGRITNYDIHDFLEESATEQIYNLAGVNDEAEEESVVKAGRARAVWLVLNLITAIISSVVISLFDESINKIVALAILMPIVASMGGNTGTQALTVTVRRLATREITFSNAKSVIGREFAIAFVNGVIFAVLVGLVAHVWFGIAGLGFVIAAAMLINLAGAGFFGAIIPMSLKRFGVDPAVASPVLLTTMTDVVGFLSFLGLATWILL
ncbi:MAG: magnesium transporter [Campylobacter sp.]|uniref:magnesium transporter n=1 Tax=Campylobacter sp. TaxID=205 RepID=UPI002A894FA5|nr:magnesium transporter [Campylobacter sp.]MCI6694675.1 magnesium transporter [Campylobacter sp.]MDY4859710.1 magnesium transporter [Campylobacter sp.]